MTRASRATLGYATGVIQYGAQIGLQVLLAPLVLRRAGAETLGVYAILMQATAYLSLLDTGMGLALTRFLAQAHGANGESGTFRDVISSGRLVLIGTGLLFAAAATVVALFIGRIFPLSAKVLVQARVCILILAGWAILRAPWSTYNNALVATQNLAASNLIATLQNTARLILTLGLVGAGLGLFGLIAGGVLAEALGLVICLIVFLRLCPDCAPQWTYKPSVVVALSRFAFQTLLLAIATRLTVGSDNIVVGYLLGPQAVAAYYTTVMPGTMGYLLTVRLSDSAAPAINELWSRGAIPVLRNNILKIHRYTLTMAFGLGGALLLFNRPLITLWVGSQRYAGLLATVSLASFAITVSASHVNGILTMATGRIRTLSIVALCEGGLNLVLSLFFGRHFGAGGVMLGSAVSNLVSTTYLQFRFSSDLAVSGRLYLRNCLLPALPSVLAACVVGGALSRSLGLASWWSLGFAGTCYTLTGLVVAWTAAIHADDKVRVVRTIRAFGARMQAQFATV
ncbi:MAG: MATE family efflux transporter [Terracidiphilus sp.]